MKTVKKLSSFGGLSSGPSSDPIAWGLQNLFGGIERGLDSRQENMQKLSEYKDKMEQLKQLEDFYESTGHSRTLAHQPEFIQKEHVKSKLRPKSTLDKVLDRFFPERNKESKKSDQLSILRDEKGKPVTIQVGEEFINANDLDPEVLKRLEEAEAEINAPAQEENWGHTLGQFATGAGVGALQKGLGFLPDIASLPFLAENLSPSPTDVKSWEYEMAERNPQQQPQNLNALDVIEAYKNMPSPLNPLKDLIPTSSNILNKYIPAATKGTALEPYTTAKTESGKRAQELGNVTGILANPTGTVAQKAGNILKSAGIALTAEAADVLGEEVTGSKAVGKGLKLATYIGASIFPGSTSKLSEEGYNIFKKDVIDKGVAEGKAINAVGFRDKVKDIANRIADDFPELTEDAKILKNELAKVNNLSYGKDQINPERMWNSIKDLGKKLRDQKYHSISPYLEELIGVEKESLAEFADTVVPNGGKILKDSNQLYKTSKQILQDNKAIRSGSGFKAGPGTLLWLTSGGYKAVVALAGAKAAKQYATRMFNDPVILELTKKLASASSSQNIALAKQVSDQLNERGEKVLSKLSAEDQKEIRKAIKKFS